MNIASIIALSMLIGGVALIFIGIILFLVWDINRLWLEVSNKEARKRVKALQRINEGNATGEDDTSSLYFGNSSGPLNYKGLEGIVGDEVGGKGLTDSQEIGEVESSGAQESDYAAAGFTHVSN